MNINSDDKHAAPPNCEESHCEESLALREIAHDLRNSLHSIRMAVVILKQAQSDAPFFADAVNAIDKENERANQLLEQLLAKVKKKN